MDSGQNHSFDHSYLSRYCCVPTSGLGLFMAESRLCLTTGITNVTSPKMENLRKAKKGWMSRCGGGKAAGEKSGNERADERLMACWLPAESKPRAQ